LIALVPVAFFGGIVLAGVAGFVLEIPYVYGWAVVLGLGLIHSLTAGRRKVDNNATPWALNISWSSIAKVKRTGTIPAAS
jgi:hypothetical protein